ncbi:hypothetical protein LA52FAK_31860 [Desulforhopalus sp. 52FAK]
MNGTSAHIKPDAAVLAMTNELSELYTGTLQGKNLMNGYGVKFTYTLDQTFKVRVDLPQKTKNVAGEWKIENNQLCRKPENYGWQCYDVAKQGDYILETMEGKTTPKYKLKKKYN